MIKTTAKLSTLVASALWTFGAHAADFIMDFASLPSRQGWTYVSQPANAHPESDIFSLSADTLIQNSIGQGDGRFLYQYSENIDWSRPFSIAMRSRLVADEGSTSRRLGAFGFYAFTGSRAYGAIFRPGIIQSYSESVITTSVDTAAFHDYVLDVSPTTGYKLFVDGVLAGSGLGTALSVAPSVSFGDGTLTVEARAEITDLRILQTIPEPASHALLLAGGVLTVFLGRRLRSS